MASPTRFHSSKTTLGAAVEAFFADRDLAPATRRAYRATYGSLIQAFGSEMPVTALTAVNLQHWLIRRWGKRSPATWNARLAASRFLSATASARAGSSTTRPRAWNGVAPRGMRHGRSPSPRSMRCGPAPISAARESPVAHALRHGRAGQRGPRPRRRDLDVGRKRAAISGKGGHREIIVWDAATARLLPRYLAGRRKGRSL